jgi:hypothetical protein
VIDRCIGSLMPTCLSTWPTDVVLLPDLNPDTSPHCNPETELACVVAGKTIIVDGIVTPSGSRPLVLVATDSVSLLGLIFMTNHSSTPCASAGTASGSGGAGGPGTSVPAIGAGVGWVAPAMDAFQLRFGCPGQVGSGMTAAVAGGRGGGALYVAAPEIYLDAWIDVSGGGGTGGASGANGGGGGGSGGMIVLDASSTITVGPFTWLEAHGGGGGEGGGGGVGDGGSVPSGGSGNNTNGGDGGAGASLEITDTTLLDVDDSTTGTSGQGSSGGSTGGGGGGGGPGLITLIGDVVLIAEKD